MDNLTQIISSYNYTKYKNLIPDWWLKNEDKDYEILNNIFEFFNEFDINPQCIKPFPRRCVDKFNIYKLRDKINHNEALDHYRFYTDFNKDIYFVNSPYLIDTEDWGKKREKALLENGFTRYKKPLYPSPAVTYYIKIPAKKNKNI